MVATVEAIYNKALSAIGTKASVAATSEATVEAQTCTLWYETVRDMVIAAAPWTSASATASLALFVTRDTAADWVATDPPPGFLYTYDVPGDMLRPRYLTDYGRFEIGMSSANARRLYTNTENAILTYTKRQASVTNFDVELEMAIVFALAAHICMKLTGKRERTSDMLELANARIIGARLNDANSQELIQDTVAPWHAARGIGLSSDNRYIFPYGPLINVGWF